ncbi:CvpA family protein [Candidatus Kuenenbacteria bacterium]|nr:CvpA family protein [Candidatus Kuenenbacteria bacterium]
MLDIFIIIILLCFLMAGFRFGFIQAIGALVGLIVGTFLAILYYDVLSNFALSLFLGNLKIAQIISFILILILVSRLVGLIFFIINKIFNIVAIIPFLKTFNRLLGGIFSLIEGILILGVILYLFGNHFQQFLINSSLAPILIKIAGILISFLPEELLSL